MSSNYKTECPRCHTVYPMPPAKLNEPKARANCGKCGYTFFLNSHLIAPPAAAPVQPTPKVAPTPSAPIPPVSQKPATTPTAATQGTQQADSIALPKIPIKKKAPPADGMIFDEMDAGKEGSSDVFFSDDELNNFVTQNLTQTTATVAATAKDNGQHTREDEAWLDELLKNDDSPDIKVIANHNSNTDDLSKIIGEDLESLIPQVETQEDPKLLMKKIQERLHSDQPTQEQLVKKRSLGSQLGWVLASLAMLLLAGAQYVFFNQNTIAKNPAQAQTVKSLCQICTLPSADVGAFKITHELKDGEADFSTDLMGSIANISDADQLYPNLKITVTGAGNALLGELVLAPKDYLAFEQSVLSSHRDGKFILTLDVPQNEINSITINPFY